MLVAPRSRALTPARAAFVTRLAVNLARSEGLTVRCKAHARIGPPVTPAIVWTACSGAGDF